MKVAFNRLVMRLVLIVAAFLVNAVPVAAATQSSPNAVRLNGDIVSVTANSLVLKTATGPQTVQFIAKPRYFSVSKSSLDKVTQNSFIGTTVVPQSGNKYVSTEVHIFAPSLRGTGEGFTKMDSGGTHMMANAAVASVARPTSRMMANSTVRSVGSNSGQKAITMVFPSGTINVTIPANTPVTYIEPGSKALLVSGAHVLVLGTRTSSGVQGRSFVVAKDGTALP